MLWTQGMVILNEMKCLVMEFWPPNENTPHNKKLSLVLGFFKIILILINPFVHFEPFKAQLPPSKKQLPRLYWNFFWSSTEDSFFKIFPPLSHD